MITINISWGDSYFSSELQKKSFADEPRAIEFLRRNSKKIQAVNGYPTYGEKKDSFELYDFIKEGV